MDYKKKVKKVKKKKEKERGKKKGPGRGHTMARYLFKLRKTSCLLMDRSSAMSMGSSRACSTASAT